MEATVVMLALRSVLADAVVVSAKEVALFRVDLIVEFAHQALAALHLPAQVLDELGEATAPLRPCGQAAAHPEPQA